MADARREVVNFSPRSLGSRAFDTYKLPTNRIDFMMPSLSSFLGFNSVYDSELPRRSCGIDFDDNFHKVSRWGWLFASLKVIEFTSMLSSRRESKPRDVL
jgi:hypothetical protein